MQGGFYYYERIKQILRTLLANLSTLIKFYVVCQSSKAD